MKTISLFGARFAQCSIVMRYVTTLLASTLFGALALSPTATNAQVMFSDDFETDTSANWTIFDGARSGPSDYTAEFAFDYSVHGIPPAPRTTGGTTRGLKLTVNKDDTAAEAAVSLYPNNQSFFGDYSLKFDMWINYNGPSFGGVGSTENATFGLNHTGDKVNWVFSGTSDGVWFTVCGEGGAARDYRAYVGDPAASPIELLQTDGGFLDRDGDGTREVETQPNTFTQLDHIFPTPPFETPGAPGKRWVQVEVRQRNNLITWLINGYVIAEHANVNNFTFGNIMIGYMDIFASIANPKAENFIIYDNIRVEEEQPPVVLPVVSIVASDASAAEPGADTGTYTIARTGDTGAALTVAVRVTGTASNGADYVSIPVSITIPAGASETNVTVTPINDQIGEPTETVTVALVGAPLLYELRENIAATVDLADDGDKPIATLIARRPLAYEFIPERKGQFHIRFTNPNSIDTTVFYTVAGTAISGADYNALPGSIVIPAGETNAFVDVVAIDNSALDTNRTVIMTLTESLDYTLAAPSNATVTIRNDDLPPGKLLYADNFDLDSSTGWMVNKAHANNEATFAYDYSQVGIPPAPNSTAGSTIGLKLEANTPTGAPTFTGLSASPIGQGFQGDYRLRFDMWINYNGPLELGGPGSTFVQSAGVGTAGVTPQWAGGNHDSVWFAVSGDGGSGQDYRVYPRASIALPASGFYAAGTGTAPDARNNTHPYYSEFGRESSPPLQGQSGTTSAGAVGMAWHDILIVKQGANISWYIDGLRIVTAPDPGSLSTNIFVGFADINTTQSQTPSLCFGLVDNLRVETLTLPRPRITAIRHSGGTVEIDFTAEEGDLPSAFELQTATTATGSFGPATGATITALGGNQFRATAPVTGNTQFWRIRK